MNILGINLSTLFIHAQCGSVILQRNSMCCTNTVRWRRRTILFLGPLLLVAFHRKMRSIGLFIILFIGIKVLLVICNKMQLMDAEQFARSKILLLPCAWSVWESAA